MTFGERLRKLRNEYGVTLEEVGEYIGVKRPTVFKYENGIITNIPSDKVEAIARMFSVSPAYLMGWTDDSSKEHIFTPVLAPNSEEFRRIIMFMTPDDYKTMMDIYSRTLRRMIENGVRP
ncbi:MAG: helix-turn-helix domain-containing protein [Clostridiales bacterium]|nr:helix-turn-helix domain-containing protein [Clostridiales bacterium]